MKQPELYYPEYLFFLEATPENLRRFKQDTASDLQVNHCLVSENSHPRKIITFGVRNWIFVPIKIK